MSGDATVVSPRRLVVYFRDDFSRDISGNMIQLDGTDLSYGMIQDDKDNRPQLVHKQRIFPAPDPSRLDRLFFRLGRKPRPSKALKEVNRRNDQAIADALGFVSHKYQSGDQVILLSYQSQSGEQVIKAMEIVAHHLHDGATPGGKNAPGPRIPIFGIAAFEKECRIGMGGISSINDELKSRFPPGIKHVTCASWPGPRYRTDPRYGAVPRYRIDPKYRTCSTVINLDGVVISREITTYDDVNPYYNRLIHTTRDIIYYKPRDISTWDNQIPVWTKVLGSSPSEIPGNLPLPAGIYRQELTRYKRSSILEMTASERLVWKSFRH